MSNESGEMGYYVMPQTALQKAEPRDSKTYLFDGADACGTCTYATFWSIRYGGLLHALVNGSAQILPWQLGNSAGLH